MHVAVHFAIAAVHCAQEHAVLGVADGGCIKFNGRDVTVLLLADACELPEPPSVVMLQGMVGYRFNTVGVSDAISMGTDGMSYSLQVV